jgi:hypothetical protein
MQLTPQGFFPPQPPPHESQSAKQSELRFRALLTEGGADHCKQCHDTCHSKISKRAESTDLKTHYLTRHGLSSVLSLASVKPRFSRIASQ